MMYRAGGNKKGTGKIRRGAFGNSGMPPDLAIASESQAKLHRKVEGVLRRVYAQMKEPELARRVFEMYSENPTDPDIMKKIAKKVDSHPEVVTKIVEAVQTEAKKGIY